jgi:hypothetical protein
LQELRFRFQVKLGTSNKTLRVALRGEEGKDARSGEGSMVAMVKVHLCSGKKFFIYVVMVCKKINLFIEKQFFYECVWCTYEAM